MRWETYKTRLKLKKSYHHPHPMNVLLVLMLSTQVDAAYAAGVMF